VFQGEGEVKNRDVVVYYDLSICNRPWKGNEVAAPSRELASVRLAWGRAPAESAVSARVARVDIFIIRIGRKRGIDARERQRLSNLKNLG
jgi:hypothetical protein